MLRVTRSEAAGRISFKLEGKLAGSWVDVMEESWRQAVAEGSPEPVTVDLNSVTYVDSRGTDLLCEMHRSGVELRAASCLGKGIVEQVTSCSRKAAEDRH